MSDTLIFLIVGAAIVALMAGMIRSLGRPGNRRGSGGPGPGASGAVYDMLNEDKRKAIEIILEERAAYRDPESADDQPPEAGNSPHRSGVARTPR